MLLLFLCLSFTAKAQVTIGSGNEPQKFSILEIVSNKIGGLRMPHLTTTERDALTGTTSFQSQDHRGSSSNDPGLGLGLTIYNTDTNCTEYWNGNKWVSLCLGTANIVLKSPCGDYDPNTPPVVSESGNSNECIYTPEDTPSCIVPSGKAYEVYLTAGSSYASIEVDQLTSSFIIRFQPNNSSFTRIAVVRVTNNCSGEFKDFIFTQKGGKCPDPLVNPTLNAQTLSLCENGSVYAEVTNAQTDIDYIWTYGGVIVHTGNWYEIKRSGVYTVYTGLLGCPTPAVLTVTDNVGSIAPGTIAISATNSGILCSTGNVILTAETSSSSGTVVWYHNGLEQPNTGKNITVSGAAAAGEWFAAIKDVAGCMSSSSNVINLINNTDPGIQALPAPTATVNGQSLTNDDLIICKDGTLRLVITNLSVFPPGTVFEWFSNGISIGKTTSGVLYVVPVYTANMTLSVMASDQSGSCPNTIVSKEATVTFTSSPSTTINNGATQAAICGNTGAALIADYAGGVEYEWIKDGVVIQSLPANTKIYTAISPGKYCVRYKDSNGCWSKLSTNIEVIQSAPVKMVWTSSPSNVVKNDQVTYSIVANPNATQYIWTWSDDGANDAIISINPIGDGNSAVVTYGSPVATSTGVKLRVASVGHPCGDSFLEAQFNLTDGCIEGTSVNLVPAGSIIMQKGETRYFQVSTNATNNNSDLRYEWLEDSAAQGSGTPTINNGYLYTASQVGDHSLTVYVTNDCSTPGRDLFAKVNIKVTEDPADYADDNTGNFKLSGKNCYDISQSNFGPDCGIDALRPGDFLDSERNWAEGRIFSYTFSSPTGTAFSDLSFIAVDKNVLLKTQQQSGNKYIITFDESVLTKAKGLDRSSAIRINLYAVFTSGGQKKKVLLRIGIQDCTCKCGAYISSSTWKEFMCHNLGADESADPFIPDRKLHGDWYQWGRSTIAAFGPNNPDPAKQNQLNGSWNSTAAPSESWRDAIKTANDPCPDGYRVPTKLDWEQILNTDLNTQAPIGTWGESGAANYLSGRKIGKLLFLPAAGNRNPSYGILNLREVNGYYWTSSIPNYDASYLGISNNNSSVGALSRKAGFSVRCISEE